MKKQTNITKKGAAIKVKSQNAPVKAKKTAEWIMSVKSFEKNGCMINNN